jgi:hypothetical protein
MKPAKPLDLTRTAAALAAYDAAGDAFDKYPSQGNITALECARLDLAHAFADDTADRNDRATVLGFVQSLVGMTFVRRMVASFGPEAAAGLRSMASLRVAERAGRVA